ncbi:predicted protein [Nematostella vectensis]|uniref:Uncharacterized protein n=1 Tax=Nematostella vectensis TaxID=45351 RepID=A7S7G4_NEMVE|nr:predicted protein [Nematostella vectensis]|eukprot:XP_001632385.1 predicted protein [Nematostella vectensis]
MKQTAEKGVRGRYGKCPAFPPPASNCSTDGADECAVDQDCKAGEVCCESGCASGNMICRPVVKNCFVTMDVALAVDTSDGMSDADLAKTKSLVTTLVNQFSDSENSIRFGITTYGQEARTLANFKQNFDEAKLRTAIKGIQKTGVQARRHDLAAMAVKNDLFSLEGGMRQGHPRFVIFFSAGANTGTADDLKKASKPLTDLGVNMIAIGVNSNADQASLAELASENRFIFSANSPAELDALWPSIEAQMCQEKPGKCPPSPPSGGSCGDVTPEEIPCGESVAGKEGRTDKANDWDCPGEQRCCKSDDGCHSVCKEPPNVCENAAHDLAILIESSDSVGAAGFEKAKKFAKDIVNAFKIGTSGTHVSVTTFGASSSVNFNFNSFSSIYRRKSIYRRRVLNFNFNSFSVSRYIAVGKFIFNSFSGPQLTASYINENIDQIKFLGGSPAAVNAALDQAVNNSLVIIGSGQFQDPAVAIGLGAALKQNLVDVFAVPVGDNPDVATLRSFASPNVEKNVFMTSSHNALRPHVRAVTKAICDGAIKIRNNTQTRHTGGVGNMNNGNKRIKVLDNTQTRHTSGVGNMNNGNKRTKVLDNTQTRHTGGVGNMNNGNKRTKVLDNTQTRHTSGVGNMNNGNKRTKTRYTSGVGNMNNGNKRTKVLDNTQTRHTSGVGNMNDGNKRTKVLDNTQTRHTSGVGNMNNGNKRTKVLDNTQTRHTSGVGNMNNGNKRTKVLDNTQTRHTSGVGNMNNGNKRTKVLCNTQTRHTSGVGNMNNGNKRTKVLDNTQTRHTSGVGNMNNGNKRTKFLDNTQTRHTSGVGNINNGNKRTKAHSGVCNMNNGNKRTKFLDNTQTRHTSGVGNMNNGNKRTKVLDNTQTRHTSGVGNMNNGNKRTKVLDNTQTRHTSGVGNMNNGNKRTKVLDNTQTRHTSGVGNMNNGNKRTKFLDNTQTRHTSGVGNMNNGNKRTKVLCNTQTRHTSGVGNMNNECDRPVDVYFGIPVSGSVAPQFANIKKMFTSLLSLLKVNNRLVHTGLIRYSDTADVVLNLNRVYNRDAVGAVINQIPISGSSLNLARAFEVAADHGFTIYGGVRQTVPKIFVVYIPGPVSSPPAEVQAAVTKLKGLGVRVVLLGLDSNIDKSLYSTVSTQPSRKFVLTADSFAGLNLALNAAANRICNAKYGRCPKPPPAPPSCPAEDDLAHECSEDKDCKTEGDLCCQDGCKQRTCKDGVKSKG